MYGDFSDRMDQDGDAYYDGQESQQQTQTQTQTQQASQIPQISNADSHIWGYLQPCRDSLQTVHHGGIKTALIVVSHLSGREVQTTHPLVISTPIHVGTNIMYKFLRLRLRYHGT